MFVNSFAALDVSSSVFSLPLQSIWRYETRPLTSVEIPEISVVFVRKKKHTPGRHRHECTRTHTHADAHTHARTQARMHTHTCTSPKCYFQQLWSWRKTGAYWDEAWGLEGDNVGMIVCPASPLFPETKPHQRPQLATKGGRKRERAVFQFSAFCNSSPASNGNLCS